MFLRRATTLLAITLVSTAHAARDGVDPTRYYARNFPGLALPLGADAMPISTPRLGETLSPPEAAGETRFLGSDEEFPIEVSVLDAESIDDLFGELWGSPEIPFDYLRDGCHVRSYIMSKMLEERGIFAAQAFLRGDERMKLKTGWRWHIAPVLLQRGSEGIEPIVLDPSVARRPLSMDEWMRETTQGGYAEITFMNRFSTPLHRREAARDALLDTEIERKLGDYNALQRYEFNRKAPGRRIFNSLKSLLE